MVSHVRNTWKPGGIAFVALTVSAVVLAGSPVQAADEDSSLAPAEVYAALESASEVEGIPAPLAHLDRSRALDAGEPLSITTPRAKVSLKIGGNDVPGESIGDGLLAYENLPGVATVPIGRSDGSVQVITVLEDASSPTEFTYTLEGQDGSTLRELDEGFVSLFDSSGAPVVAVAPAWAVDANGESVPTWYEVEGNELVQHVAHDSSFEYPIVADPWVGGTYLEVNRPRFCAASMRGAALG